MLPGPCLFSIARLAGSSAESVLMPWPMKNALQNTKRLTSAFRVRDGKKFRLADFDPADTLDLVFDHKPEAAAALQEGVHEIARLQDKLYAQDNWAVLLIFQAMDAAGKDGTIKHVLSGVKPQGCEVHSFKAPSAEELDHDFLW